MRELSETSFIVEIIKSFVDKFKAHIILIIKQRIIKQDVSFVIDIPATVIDFLNTKDAYVFEIPVAYKLKRGV